jgi:hypothetical protein
MGGSVDLGGGALLNAGPPPDVFVAKFDGNGHHVFSRGFGDSDHQEGNGLALDTRGNALLTGFSVGQIDFGQGPLIANSTNGDVFVAKIELP